MGTRALTVMCDDNFGEEIAVLYRQFDGYLDGHGQELADLLTPLIPTNGFPNRDEKFVNGSRCLAATIVAHFKKEVGGFYLYPAGTRNVGEEYVYVVSIVDDPATSLAEHDESRYGKRAATIHVRVEDVDHDGNVRQILYDGPARDME